MKVVTGEIISINNSGFHNCAYTLYRNSNSKNDGTYIIMVHGLILNRTIFETAARVLSNIAPVVCFDFVGHGESSHLKEEKFYRASALFMDMISIINFFQIKKLIVVGHSLGGIISGYLSGLENTIVIGCCLIDITYFIPSSTKRVIYMQSYLMELNHKLSTLTGKILEKSLAKVLAHLPNKNVFGDMPYEHRVTTLLNFILDSKKTCVDSKCMRGMINFNSLKFDLGVQIKSDGICGKEIIDKIKCSILLLRGKYSRRLMPKFSVQYMCNMPNVQNVIIADAGHFITLNSAERIIHIERWILKCLQSD